MRVGLAQITSVDKFEDNLRTVEDLYLRALANRAELVIFPENTLYFRIRKGAPVHGVRLDGSELSRLKHLVTKHGLPLLLTTSEAIDGNSKQLNSTIFLEPNVEPKRLYSKVNLFDVDVPGAPPVRESDFCLPGERPQSFEFKGWKIGLSICFDVRFADLYLQFGRQMDVLLIPSAFLVPTGEAHWHVLVRARAIENQCYVLAPAQSGEHRSGDQVRHTYGHALAVDPWGRVLCDLVQSPEVRVIELDREEIAKMRRQIPMPRKA